MAKTKAVLKALTLLLEVSGSGGSRLSYVLWCLSVINAIMSGRPKVSS